MIFKTLGLSLEEEGGDEFLRERNLFEQSLRILSDQRLKSVMGILWSEESLLTKKERDEAICSRIRWTLTSEGVGRNLVPKARIERVLV